MAQKQTKKSTAAKGRRKTAPKKTQQKPIRREVGARMKIRYTPLLHFVMDDSIAYGVRMTHRIDEVVSSQGGGKEE